MTITKIVLPFTLLVFSFAAVSGGNISNDSFNNAKKMLERQVYQDHRVTVYCGAKFDAKKNIEAPEGFVTTTHFKRAKKVEWEHVVPAENFGRAFSEWSNGHNECVNSKGKSFKGRECAEKMNKEYRYMQADMHNLFPAIGAVNALRSNYNFTMLPSAKSDFGSCDMRIEDRKVQPPLAARGVIARTYMYMEQTYPKYKMSKQQSQLMQVWDKQDPVSRWECKRSKRIEKLQGNANKIVDSRCESIQ
ncbi:MAG: endonuclease [Shewanella xiamenensis]|uniref:endonuclease n=1 Tax=Shewanella TaxID=22 RepID=UPI000849E839|nr:MULTISPECIES: endonuclease [Shewanella]MCD8549038.1 endonuclease [Shewanella xiamenensis]MCD8559910.1 endonuclease [Shewanella xiamenensis]MCU8024193.1 endonuclease [Shewanella sp. SM78]MDV5247491.1 endonuclease [Shewanella xiamenensis]ODR84727.1 endonuclease I [Shewanella xiamenensis]